MASSPRDRLVRAALMAVPALVLTLACGLGPPSEEQRRVQDTERGYRFVRPVNWFVLNKEARSPSGSLLTIRVLSLEGAERHFVEGLPETLFPKLEEWAKYYFAVVEPPTRREASVGGVPAVEMVYPVHVRVTDPQAQVFYWIVRRREQIYLLRAAIPAGAAAKDEPALRSLLASWRFIGDEGKN